MSHAQNRRSLLSACLVLLVGVGLACLILPGCANTKPAATTEKTQADPAASTVMAKSGNELWAANCGQCHNSRDPSEFSDVQWSLIVHHMRLHAGLTGQEQQAITKFLQASN